MGVAAAERGAGIHRRTGDALALKLRRHVFGMGDGHAERQRACLRVRPPLPQRVAGTRQRGEFVGELFRFEAPVAPRDLAIIDGLVVDAVIVEGREQLRFDPGKQVAREHQVVVAQERMSD